MISRTININASGPICRAVKTSDVKIIFLNTFAKYIRIPGNPVAVVSWPAVRNVNAESLTSWSVKYSSRSYSIIDSKSFFCVPVTFPSFINFKRVEMTYEKNDSQKQPLTDVLQNRFSQKFLQISQENTCAGVSY